MKISVRSAINLLGLALVLVIATVAIAEGGFFYYYGTITGPQYVVAGKTLTGPLGIGVYASRTQSYLYTSPAPVGHPILMQKLVLRSRVWTRGAFCHLVKTYEAVQSCKDCTDTGYLPTYALGEPEYAVSKHRLKDTRFINGFYQPPSNFFTDDNGLGNLYTENSAWRGGYWACSPPQIEEEDLD